LDQGEASAIPAALPSNRILKVTVQKMMRKAAVVLFALGIVGHVSAQASDFVNDSKAALV
jgi:hypothetical protein